MVRNVREVFQAKSAFVTDLGGKRRLVRAGELVSEGDPVLKGRSHLFVAVSEAVEQATSAPGEKRSMPAKKAAKSTASKPDDGD